MDAIRRMVNTTDRTGSHIKAQYPEPTEHIQSFIIHTDYESHSCSYKVPSFIFDLFLSEFLYCLVVFNVTAVLVTSCPACNFTLLFTCLDML